MPFIPTPDTAQMILGYVTDTGDTWSNGLFFELPGGWDETALQLLCDTAVDAWTELCAPIFAANCNLQRVSATDQASASGAYAETVPSTPIPGTRSGAAVLLNAAMSVTLRTAQRGRSYRGRIFHYGLANEDKQTEKTWQVDDAVTVGNVYDALRDAIFAETSGVLVVVSRYSGGASRITGLTTVVTTISGRVPVATQRRRVKPA
jgi:hypothetical protein